MFMFIYVGASATIRKNNEMNDIKVSADATQVLNKKKSYVKTFMRSIIQKINDPLGVKKAK